MCIQIRISFIDHPLFWWMINRNMKLKDWWTQGQFGDGFNTWFIGWVMLIRIGLGWTLQIWEMLWTLFLTLKTTYPWRYSFILRVGGSVRVISCIRLYSCMRLVALGGMLFM